MSQFNILFTSVGRRVQLINHFKRTLNELGMEGKIITTDFKNSAPASYMSDTHIVVPKISDSNYIEALKNICQKYNITLLIPLIDTELTQLSFHKEEFEEIGVTCLVSSCEVNDICFDKRNTYHFFKNTGFQTPEIFDVNILMNSQQFNFPYIIKPVNGSSSEGVNKINNINELLFFINYTPDAMLQNFVVGDEYTIDVLVDFSGNIRSVVPRLRIETRAGEVSKGLTVKNKLLIEASKKVVKALPGPLGCITLQCFITNDGEITFIEINPRFGGGVPLSFEAGADFPKYIIQWMNGEETHNRIDDWMDGLAMLRYDEAIFIEKGSELWL